MYDVDIYESEFQLLRMQATANLCEVTPEALYILNRKMIRNYLINGLPVDIILGDDLGDDEVTFEDLVNKGKITTESTDPSVISADGLHLEVVFDN